MLIRLQQLPFSLLLLFFHLLFSPFLLSGGQWLHLEIILTTKSITTITSTAVRTLSLLEAAFGSGIVPLIPLRNVAPEIIESGRILAMFQVCEVSDLKCPEFAGNGG